MPDDPSRPEHIDLAGLVRANAALRNARDRLTAEPDGDEALNQARGAINRHVVVLTDPRLWEALIWLADQQRDLERMNRDALALLYQHVPSTGSGSPDPDRHYEQLEASAWVREAQKRVLAFSVVAGEVANEPIPSAQDPARRAYSQAVRVVLDKAVDLVMSVAVAAAFAVDAVSIAAARATANVFQMTDRMADVASGAVSRGAELAAPALPWLLAATAVGVQAAAAVIAIRSCWSGWKSNEGVVDASNRAAPSTTADNPIAPEPLTTQAATLDPQHEQGAPLDPEDPALGPAAEEAPRVGTRQANSTRRSAAVRGKSPPPATPRPRGWPFVWPGGRTPGFPGAKGSDGSPPGSRPGGAPRGRR